MNFNKYTNALKIVFSSKKYLLGGILTFFIFLLLYLFTLPATYTGGRIGLVSLKMLTPELGIFSFVMAFLVGLILPMSVYSFKSNMKIKKSGAGGFFVSILPSLLCCSPLIPSIAALFAASSPAAFGVGGAIQGFIAVNEIYILIGAVALLLFSFVQTAKSITQCICKT